MDQDTLQSEALYRVVLNSITEHLAVLDGAGVITRTNKPWEDFGAANGLSQSLIGKNYLSICDQAKGTGRDTARLAAQGIREVLQGARDSFSLEYPCHSPAEKRWFLMRVSPFGQNESKGVAVTHLNITQLKTNEREQQRLFKKLKKYSRQVEQNNAKLTVQAEELFLQKEKYRTLMENIPLRIFTKDRHLRYTFANANYTRDLRINPAEILGKTDFDYYPPELAQKYRQDDQKILEGESILELEESYIIQGQRHFVQTSKVPIHDKTGQVTAICGIFRDITERKRAEEALKESEERFRTLVDLAQDIIYRLDAEGRILFISPAVAQLGYQPEDLIGKKLEKIVHPDDRPHIPHAFVERRIGNRAVKNLEARLINKAGMSRDYSLNFFTFSFRSRGVWNVPDDQITNGDKKFLYTQGIARDISHLKQVQEALRQAKEEWERTFDAVADPIAIMDKNFRITRANKALFTKLNVSPEEILGSSCYHLMHNLDNPPRFCPFIQLRKDGQEHSVEAYEKNLGGYFIITVSPILDNEGRISGVLHVAHDITERKRAEEVLRESEEKYRLLVTQMPAILFRGYPDWTVEFFDQKIEDLTGYPKEDFNNRIRKWSDLILPEDLKNLPKKFPSQEESNSFEREYRIRKKTGEIVWIRTRELVYYNAAGRLDHISGVLFDITDRKQAEEILAWHARVDASIVDLSFKLLPLTSLEDMSAMILQQALQLTDSPWGFVGYCYFEYGCLVLPSPTQDTMSHPHIDTTDITRASFQKLCNWAKNHQRILLSNNPAGDPNLKESGQDYPGILRVLAVPAELGEEVVGVIALANASQDYDTQDLTVVRRLANLYALVVQRQRMELALQKARDRAEDANRAKSDFISSVSHELRTPLNAIIGFSEILQDQHFGALNESQARKVNHILTSGRHLLSLINDILDLAKVESGKMTLDLSSVNVAYLIQNSLMMIKEKAHRHQLELKTELAADVANMKIIADERTLKQIMFNLLSNAAKYSPDGGTIKVTVKRKAENLVFSIDDTGIGIAPEDQERIFKAFERVDSSYARQQEGTGLGLALTRQLVELHGGRIWVESSGLNQGSSFSFFIPLRLEAEPET